MALRSFRGGVHPHEHKELSEHKPLEAMPVPQEIFLPLGQHLGKPAELRVKKGDYVRPGQVVAASAGPISAPVHSPVGGTVKRIVKGHVAGGTTADLIVIEAGEPAAPAEGDTPVDTSPMLLSPLDPRVVDGPTIIERVRAAGIVGQGGAAFPTAVKLSPPPDKKIDWLIINGAECEPYLTRDYRLMLERTEALVEGIVLLGRPLGPGVSLGIGIAMAPCMTGSPCTQRPPRVRAAVAANAIAPAPAIARAIFLRRFFFTPTGQSVVSSVPSARW